MRPSSASSSLPPATPRPRERSDFETLSSLFPYLWEFRWRVLVAITCLVAAKVAVVGVPVVLKQIVDLLVPAGGQAAVRGACS
jgi:ATP-binding cassette subfamily B protein